MYSYVMHILLQVMVAMENKRILLYYILRERINFYKLYNKHIPVVSLLCYGIKLRPSNQFYKLK